MLTFFVGMSPESAEICKLGVNCFVTMKERDFYFLIYLFIY